MGSHPTASFGPIPSTYLAQRCNATTSTTRDTTIENTPGGETLKKCQCPAHGSILRLGRAGGTLYLPSKIRRQIVVVNRFTLTTGLLV